jgi:putative ABC transport system ATP-binding protein
VIRLEAVRRVHGSGPAAAVALDGVSLEIGAGEFVAIAGPSGSGKTTLLNLIGAIDRPDAGRVLLEGRELGSLDEPALAALRLERIGFIFQHFNLVPVLTAGENVELPLLFRNGLPAAERRRRARTALERVGLGGKAGRRPSELSGGERQRVAVARALAGEPGLVLADEPTANLDHETGGAVVELMHELNRERGTTFLYATHDPELIRRADRVVRLRDGRLAEGGA